MINIFTDGSSRGNPGPGGYAAILIFDDKKVVEVGGRENATTNNRMEIMGVIAALNTVRDTKDKITIFTDSSYVLKGATAWLSGWKRKGWMTAAKEPVSNRDLWEKMDIALTGKDIAWELVPGHAGMPLNERCDEIATAFADENKVPLYVGPVDAYEISLEIKIDNALLAAKDSKKARSSAKAYSYVSMIDGTTMVHHNWAECEARVKGKSGAKFRKVFSAEEERDLIKEWSGR